MYYILLLKVATLTCLDTLYKKELILMKIQRIIKVLSISLEAWGISLFVSQFLRTTNWILTKPMTKDPVYCIMLLKVAI